jgi:hypothetical protein
MDGGTAGRIIVARLVPSSTAHNTLNLPPAVPIHFHRSPDFPQGDVRGIDGLDFQVVSSAGVQVGRTGPDGKADVRVPPGGSATLQLLVNGTPVAEYVVTIETAPFTAATAVQGQQERLRTLGYQIGHSGADGNGVDGSVSQVFERSVLDFQADQGLVADGVVGPQTRGRLTARAGG